MEREISSISTTSTITRRVRNRPTSNTIEYISPEAIKTYSEEESIASSASSDYADEDFETCESGEGEDGHDVDIAVDVDLGCGVVIQTSESLEEYFKCYKADIWSPEEKNESLLIPHEGKSQNTLQFVTEMYKIRQINNKIHANSSWKHIYNKTEKRQPMRYQCGFSIQEKYSDQFCFKIPHTDTNPELTDYSALIYCNESDDKKWDTVQASYNGTYVQFTACRFDSFVIVTTPKSINGVVQPSGTTLQIDNSYGLQFIFDKQCVQTEQQFSCKVQPKYICNLGMTRSPQNSLVKGCSEKICLKYEKESFKSFSLICKVENENGSDFEGEIRLVSFNGNKATVVDGKPDGLGNNKYRAKINGCDSVALVSLAPSQVVDSDFDDTLTRELEVVYKEKYICRLMLFYHKKIGNTLHFVAECCLMVDSEAIKRKHRNSNNKQVYESVDLYLPPQQRIRIHPSGAIANIHIRPGMQVHNFLFFMYVSRDNMCAFSVQLNRSMGGSPNAMLEFSADNQSRGVITNAEFNVDQLHKRSIFHRPLSRGYTFVGSNALPTTGEDPYPNQRMRRQPARKLRRSNTFT